MHVLIWKTYVKKRTYHCREYFVICCDAMGKKCELMRP